ncbi:hypothetical protein [Burkholderia gladioli]|uniref:hypothetical protein n=1 Tax=Burkholderia gladioli TaxID=28095 RepID=UPI001641CA6F|nr:hypothetical protein [Burkholderia gladioli]
MTIVVLWRSKQRDQILCIADTRLSKNEATLTDHGPKILPVPVVSHRHEGGAKWRAVRRTTVGFAYSGSSLAAMGTHSIASACTQNLTIPGKNDRPVPLDEIAELFRTVAEHYVKDMASRLGFTSSPSSAFFDGIIFGHCYSQKKLRAFKITPILSVATFNVDLTELNLNEFHVIGSGKRKFLELHNELNHSHPNPGMLTTFGEMIVREVQPDVGGHAQIGIADQKGGFRLQPFLNPGINGATLSFLGWNINTVNIFSDFQIGFEAFKNDAMWNSSKKKL